ncbi:MAG TPA: TIGR03960 family B12-binding radical SAM protein [Actinobacteria bacterium]|nr:TIGR03960 family B12-binding radical SAM protein [Actinomycetota bacterium]
MGYGGRSGEEVEGRKLKNLWPKIEKCLPFVEKPVRYINNEWNSKRKIPKSEDIIFALAYPDIYEIGMSNLAIQILYEILNECKNIVCERVFAPWVDMEAKMREENIPLFTLESHFPVNNCDVLGFTLQYEMIYTNVLNMLDLAQIPLFAKDREEACPLVIGGGPCVFNPEPLAPFFDLFIIGDGEDLLLEFIGEFKKQKRAGEKREKILEILAKMPGIYVPSLYKVDYHSLGLIKKIEPASNEIPKTITKNLFKDINEAKFPTAPIIPFTQVVHDRCSLEIARGCTRGCRFCQAGMIYRPARERSKENLKNLSETLLNNTGYEEISLLSLSSGDHKEIKGLITDIMMRDEDKGIAVSLPSLRMDSFSVKLAKQIQRVKKTGLTFAPEAGTQRLRDVINKNLTDEDILLAAKSAFKNGWRKLKLYFMIGLPTETQEDLQGIVELVNRVVSLGLDIVPRNERGRLKINVNASSFVPKAHTPFQWVGQNTLDQLLEKQGFLKKHLRGKNISFGWHEAKLSVIEGVMARGDRRLAKVIEMAWNSGCKFDAWMEYFDFEKWREALEKTDLSIDFYAYRERSLNEVFAWDHISAGVTKNYLEIEYNKALKKETTGDCRFGSCNKCGVCGLTDS